MSYEAYHQWCKEQAELPLYKRIPRGIVSTLGMVFLVMIPLLIDMARSSLPEWRKR